MHSSAFYTIPDQRTRCRITARPSTPLQSNLESTRFLPRSRSTDSGQINRSTTPSIGSEQLGELVPASNPPSGATTTWVPPTTSCPPYRDGNGGHGDGLSISPDLQPTTAGVFHFWTKLSASKTTTGLGVDGGL